MYRCRNCGAVVEDYEIKIKKICYEAEYGLCDFGTRTLEDVCVCPKCESYEVEELEEEEIA